MFRKRKQRKCNTNLSTGSDNGMSSPDEKKARESSSSGSVFDSLTDNTLDAKISVFVTKNLVTGLEIFPYEHSSPVTGMIET